MDTLICGGFEHTMPHQAIVMILVCPDRKSPQLTKTTGTGYRASWGGYDLFAIAILGRTAYLDSAACPSADLASLLFLAVIQQRFVQ